MTDEVNTAIITCIDQNFEENLEFDFLETLYHQAQYSGEVIVLDYGMSAEAAKRIKEKFPVTVYQCEKELSVFSVRFKHIPEVIASLSEEITQVMVADGGDLWFQNTVEPMFTLTKQRIGVIAENRIIGNDEWTDSGIHNLQEDVKTKILRVLQGKFLVNAGVVCGDRKKIADIYKKVYEDIWDCGMDYFGVDQLFLNYEWYQLQDSERVTLECKYNYVLVSHAEDEYEIKDNIVYDKTGELITIVHNAGGNWRKIKRPFANKFINEKQYHVSNVNKIMK